MSDQAAVGKDVFAYTIDALRAEFKNEFAEHDLRYQQRFDAQEKAVGDALKAADEKASDRQAAADRAVSKQETAYEKRFDSVNEFRRTLSDQTNTFVARPEFSSEMRNVREKIDDLAGIAAELRSKQEHFSGERFGAKEDRTSLYATAGFVLVLVTIGSVVVAFLK